MPKAVHDLAIKLQGKGKSEDSAWAIANSQLGKTTKNDKNLGEMMQDQSPSMTNLKPSPQNTGTWPTVQIPSTWGNQMSQMREDGSYSPPQSQLRTGRSMRYLRWTRTSANGSPIFTKNAK